MERLKPSFGLRFSLREFSSTCLRLPKKNISKPISKIRQSGKIRRYGISLTASKLCVDEKFALSKTSEGAQYQGISLASLAKYWSAFATKKGRLKATKR